MKDGLLAVHEAIDERRITDVATDEIDVPPDRLAQIVQPAMAIEGIVLSKSGNFGSRRHKGFRQVRTDETVRPRYKDLGTKVARSHRAYLIFWFRLPDLQASSRPATAQAPR